MKYRILFVITCTFFFNTAHAQFWQGFLYGVGQAMQNGNRQNQYKQNQRNNSSQSSDGYIKKLESEADGFEWYRLETKEKYLSSLNEWLTSEPYGAMNKSGRIIVPRKYDEIFYREDDKEGCTGYFIVELNNNEGAYSQRGECLIPTSCEYTSIYKTMLYGKEYFRVKKGDYEGILDKNGKTIISPDKQYTDVYFNKDEESGEKYFRVKKGDYEGILDKNGKTIISPDKQYTDVYFNKDEESGEKYFRVKKGDYEGFVDKNGKTIISPDMKYETIYKQKGNDGFVYYEVKKNGHCGILDTNGKEIIPTYRQYSRVIRADRENEIYYLVTKGDFDGICSTNGTELIAPNKYTYVRFIRYEQLGDFYVIKQNGFCGCLKSDGSVLIQPNKYSGISLRETNGAYWFLIVKNGLCGVADITGKVIIAPQYTYKSPSNGNWSIEFNNTKNRFVYKQESHNKEKTLGYSLVALKTKKITATKELRITNQHNAEMAATSDASVVVNPSASAASDGLLYEGIYTRSSQGYCAELGGYNQVTGTDQRMYIKIYTDYILVDGCRHDYVKASGHWRIYEGPQFSGTTVYYKVNPTNFDMSCYMTSFNTYTSLVNTTTYAMAKGETVFNKYSNNNSYNNNGSYNGNSKVDYDHRKKDILNRVVGEICTHCKGTGKCPACNGKKIAHSFGNSYKCTVCNPNGDCPVCHGTKKTSWNK